ncbi:MAG TPA: YsnF/AvaK domain-containing protein [Longimicrobium sp.]|nr:YsnF/AvaK domain-containing protein [Longimicrobium sp.]
MLEKLFNGDDRNENELRDRDPNLLDRETRIRERMSAQGLGEEEATRLVLKEEELAVGKRAVEAGEVGVSKHVETERVRENVTLRHDEVEVERRPITDGYVAGGADTVIGDNEEIRIPLHAEEAVVEKRVVPTEELVVRKRSVAENEVVEADLRHEEAEVHREGETLRNDRMQADTHPRDGMVDEPLRRDDRDLL